MKRRSIRLCTVCVLVLALCMFGCADRCSAAPDNADEITSVTEPPVENSSEPITVTEDEITIPNGQDGSALPTLPAGEEQATPAAETPAGDTPEPTEVPFDPLEVGGEDDPTATPGSASKTTPNTTDKTTSKPTATPAVTAAPASASPSPAPTSTGNGDIELPELP